MANQPIDQERYWNEQGGPRWVAMQRVLDAQLEPFGAAVASELALATGERVLDVGCGAGATSLMLAERVRPGEVVGIDISAPLLARAAERARPIENLSFTLADAQAFDFSPASFDVIFSRFGVMFFADPIVAFRNLRAALKPRGRIGFVCWRAMHDNPSFVLPLEAALPFIAPPPEPADPDAPGPFSFARKGRIADVLERAGYTDVVIRADDTELVFGGGADLEGAVDLAISFGPLSRALGDIDDATRARVRGAVRDVLAPHRRDGRVVLPAACWIVSARG